MIDALTEYWNAFRRWCSRQAERLSSWLHPGWRIAPLTTGRVMEFHDFLRDCGFEAAYEEMSAGGVASNGHTRKSSPESEPMGLGALADEMESGPGRDVDRETAHEVAAQLRARIVEEGRLVELNQILFDVSEEEARHIPTEVVEAVFANFLIGWLRHLTRLMGTAGVTASQPTAAE